MSIERELNNELNSVQLCACERLKLKPIDTWTEADYRLWNKCGCR